MPRVLLIEPDTLLAATYAAALTAAGYRADCCVGAQAAIMAADTARPDAVIMELQLTGHNGLEFLHEFRSYPEWQDIPIVLLTNVPPGEFAGGRAALMRQLGIRGYLYKPQADLRQLLCVVRGIVAAGMPA